MSGTTTVVTEIPDCDLCTYLHCRTRPAVYDGVTCNGTFAYMCEEHFQSYGVGLGVGRGQRLLLPGDKEAGPDLVDGILASEARMEVYSGRVVA